MSDLRIRDGGVDMGKGTVYVTIGHFNKKIYEKQVKGENVILL